MKPYILPTERQTVNTPPKIAYLVASGDLRHSANIAGWPAQQLLEQKVAAAFDKFGWQIQRANLPDTKKGHGFIASQRQGLEVFKSIPIDAPLVVAEAVWQYSHHILAGLRDHEGPILTLANFAPEWPGLVGLLGLNGGLTKMNKPYSTIWSVDFSDDWALEKLDEWLRTGEIMHDVTHVRVLPELKASPELQLGRALARELKTDKAIIGIFDEGTMGMYNAIIDDELMNSLGIYKERLSQSALWAEMQLVDEAEARDVGLWLTSRGMSFELGEDDGTELTDAQLLWQYKMYIAILRIADDFGVDGLGIQYQQGLKDLSPASDLAEGLINNLERPPVLDRTKSRVLWENRAIPLANEADEGVAIDSLVTNRLWTAMGLDPAATLHDVRWGETFDGEFVWTFEISGAVPPSHFANGYADARGIRQNPVYFPLGGSTIQGISKPGEIVWSRVYIAKGSLHLDIGRATAVELPASESARRSQATNPEWPIMHAILHGVTRDQFMAQHKANHLNVAYAPDADSADRALIAKAAMFDALGVEVHLCGAVTL